MSILSEYNLDVFYCYTAPPDRAIPGRIVRKGVEIVELITDGEVLFETFGQMNAYGRGTIFWHKEYDYTVHISVPGKPYSCIAFQFVARQKRLVPRVSHWVDLSTMDLFIQKVFQARQQEHCDLDILEQCFRGELLWNAYRSTLAAGEQVYPASLARILSFIGQHPEADFDLRDVALSCGVSLPHLFHLFHTHMGKTPMNYIMESRLKYAALMIARSNLPIKEIAEKSGFRHLEVFYRRFKSFYGCSPGLYRNRHQGNTGELSGAAEANFFSLCP